MEALESYVAEVSNVLDATAPLGSPPTCAKSVDWRNLPRQYAQEPSLEQPIGWSSGINLLNGDPMWAPGELVHLNFTLPQPEGNGWLFASSNGLASGNTPDEALVHAICEVIERDSRTRWFTFLKARIGTRIDPSTISSSYLIDLLDRFEAADVDYMLWDITGPVGVPTFLCSIQERDGPEQLSAKIDSGSGCHPNREIALSRAITEAAQMRLTYLTGARDDQSHACYAPAFASRRGGQPHRMIGGKSFADIPSAVSNTASEDLDILLHALIRYGVEAVFAYHFDANQVLGLGPDSISVTRVIVPNLVGPKEAHNEHLLGATRIR
jgi:YcaO-like protein with predicted kinase domain